VIVWLETLEAVAIHSFSAIEHHVAFGVRKPMRRVRRQSRLQGNTSNVKENAMDKLEIKGNWNIAKGKLKKQWANLTDDDLQYVEGNEEELYGRIQKRTGASRDAVQKAIRDAGSSS
jgi:uncharacterized protein YjbJ (UPF0337 family)